MKAILQRVAHANVEIGGKTVAEIQQGLLVLLGICPTDDVQQADFLAAKTAQLRIFEDDAGKMNRSLLDINGEIIVVSNFTLYADARHGRRPSFIGAARPEQAIPLYERFVAALRDEGVASVQTGEFGAEMKVSLLNDGPVTIILDTDEIMKQ